jgi:hypothetical protein
MKEVPKKINDGTFFVPPFIFVTIGDCVSIAIPE